MIHLNEKQQRFVDLAIDWFYHSSSTLLELAGYAGTGKSVVISEILRRLNLPENSVLPMAYTGQACTIMRKRGLKNACTCHSGLFNPVQEVVLDQSTGKAKMNSTFNVPLVKWKFIPKDFSNSGIKLIILDEAWMIPKHFKQFIDSTGIKVIAAGDPGQLPPIGDAPGYLQGDAFMLTELMRQEESSPIVYIANRAREGLPIEPGLYGNDVLVIFDDELDNNIISRSDIILCGKNNTRDILNNKVRREIIGVTFDYPLFGERLICRKNNWDKIVDGIPLVNGLVGTVVSPPDIGKFTGEILVIDFIPDLLEKPFMDVNINHKYLNASKDEKEKLKTNPYLQGDIFEYAYASTVHLSQGSEYNSGVYIEEFMRGDIQNALNYTAITRFKNKLVYVKHKPKFWSL